MGLSKCSNLHKLSLSFFFFFRKATEEQFWKKNPKTQQPFSESAF